ncbi:MAG TPA: NAD(P)/FAD-dependent oxidoreductase, partial [Candidatus Binatia bacterium]|nr:NAD(P)/FAD-dependent oxidoreductase [Candidatus Binatia bacterium]
MVDADCIVVGLRCAGAPLSLELARAGVKIIALERDELYTDQPFSTHAIQPYGMRLLDRLGLGDAVRALAPRALALRMQIEDAHLQADLSDDAHDARCPRRLKLDPLLQRAVVDAGIDVRPRTTVIGLVRDADRVAGVRVRDAAGEHELRAPLVVGADGRNSTIARLVGAPAYVEDTSPHGAYWAYFEETPLFSSDPRYDWGMCIHMQGDGARAVFQTDSGLLLMAGLAPRDAIAPWRRNPDTELLAYLRAGELTAPLLEGSRQATPAVGLAGLRFFVKQAVGPGWALVGDAGLHLDPTPGLGITDALRDAIALAEAIVDGSQLAFARYWRRRDADSIGLYRMAADMGSGTYNTPFTRMVYRRAQASGAMRRRLLAVLDRDCRPQEMLPISRLIGWLASEAFRRRFESFSGFGRTLRLTL